MIHLVFFFVFVYCFVEFLLWASRMTLKVCWAVGFWALSRFLRVEFVSFLLGSVLARFRLAGLFASQPTLSVELNGVLSVEDLVSIPGGDARMGNEGVGHLSLTGALVARSRLRGRSVWVCRLEELLGGRRGVVADLLARRWVPDLPSRERSPVANALIGNLESGAKLLGGGAIQNGGGETRTEVWYEVELPEGERVVVFPDLLASLQSYSIFRSRDAALLAALRARAREWCKLRLPTWVWPLAMPGAIALATARSASELSGMEVLSAVGNTTLLSACV